MNDSDLHEGLHDYYESITPASSHRATTRVAAAIREKRERRKAPGLWRQVAAIAVAGAVVVALALMPFALPTMFSPAATSSPTASAVASPSMPLSTVSPAPSPLASPTQIGDWKVLAASDTVEAFWSPDGNWLAVQDGVTNGTPAQQHLRLFDRSGNLVRSLDGDSIVWLDATQFVLSRGNSSFLGSVASADLTPIATDIGEGDLSNSHGAVAVATLASDQAKDSFVVWTQAGTSRVLPGDPSAWSPDGAKLAVWHYVKPVGPQGTGSQPPGWLEVLSWPDLRAVVSIKSASFSRWMTFDPSGRYLLAGPGHTIVDTTTGQLIGPTVTELGSPVWDSASNLVAPALDGSVTTYPISGGPGVTQAGVGDTAVASTDGSTILLYFASSQDNRPITLLRNGASRTIAVPGPVPYGIALSPDGSGVVITCQVEDKVLGEVQEALLLVG
jgi:hypothetical protein